MSDEYVTYYNDDDGHDKADGSDYNGHDKADGGNDNGCDDGHNNQQDARQ